MRAEEPKFSPTFSVAYSLLKKGIDPDRLERPHFDALTEQAGREGADYNAQRAFAQNAIATWTELRDAGIRDDYGVRSLFEGDARYDLRDRAKDIHSDFAAISGYLAQANAAQAEKALDMIAGSARGALKKAEMQLAGGGLYRGEEHFSALAKITTLKTMALEYGDKPGFGEQIRDKANALAADLYPRYRAFEAARDFSYVIHDAVHGNTDQMGFDGKAGDAVRKLFAAGEPARAQVMAMINKLEPGERAQVIEALSRAFVSYEQTLELAHASELAKQIWSIDHGAAPFAPSFGSHPVLGKLFAHAGEEVRIETNEGKTLNGRLVLVKDWDPDKEGTAAIAGVPGADPLQVLAAPLAAVTKISTQDRVLFDPAVDGALGVRAFAPLDATQSELLQRITGHYVVGDYTVNRETIGELAALAAEHVPGAKALLESVKDRSPRAEHLLNGSIVARYLIDMLKLDLGPKVISELAVVAYGAVNGNGYKAWAFDREALMGAGGGVMAWAVEVTKDRAYGMLDLLQKGPIEARIAMIENAIQDLPAKLGAIKDDDELTRRLNDFWKAA